MAEMETICPYPGLRPFNEDESIFFKGREEHIEKIISLLEKNKFLMLTGASGDGKSSLVYAGLVPNARAGFFKARYNNWLVADFRPERTPLKNLSKSLAAHFKQQPEDVEKELSYGFSSLVDLYKSTPFYINQNSEEWLNADEKGKRLLKRKGANLLILVDQFEEFFTNPENYTNGKPSLQAQAVINLLLETANIALAQDLPIYIICTMRSDYIGQCADFRGLPEYIGFSQFFVPRLKRKEIHQVIDEPALLSGNKISNRLTETLINELVHGLDQLPVLQHALNQIWNKSKNKEMDLLHLAQLAGLSKDVLPEKDKAEFTTWFKEVADFKRPYFQKPSLNNVLNAHANELYETAREHYNASYGKNITDEQAHLIIKKAFQCLTKIDDSRAVRNRMTLAEITYVINKPGITADVVSGLLEQFRMQGNTFLKPFITDDPASKVLSNEAILDITHESLIRNWDILKQWAEEEDDNRQTYLDFYKQLERWVANDKSDDYLLPAGPLSFFETWFDQCHPNKYWLLKYDESDKTVEEKLAIADKVMKNTIEFLSKSRRAITSKRNLIIAAALVVFVFLSGFTVWALMERKNALTQQEIADKKTQEAMSSERDAHRAKISALELKTKAEESKSQAEIAKENALSAQQEAMQAKLVADRERGKAEKQTLVAIGESRKAEEQRMIADEARDKALAAEAKAKKLTLISVAQALALKSAIIEEDAQLQGILAVQSYNFTKLNDENTQNPIVYEALRASYTKLNTKSTAIVSSLSTEPRTIYSNAGETEMLSAGKLGVIDKIDLANGSVTKRYAIAERRLILYTLMSADGKKMICGTKDGAITLWNIADLENITKTELVSGGQQLSVAAFNASGTMLVTASNDSILGFWNLSNTQPSSIATINAQRSVNYLLLSDDGQTTYYTTNKGEINSVGLANKQIVSLFTSKKSIPLCLAMSKGKNELAAGFASGRVRIINLSDLSVSVLSDHTARVEQVAYNPEGSLLASSSADKTIRVYDLDKKSAKPIVLRDQQIKARSIIFINNHKLAAGLPDKTIHSWELSSEKIVEEVCPLLTRNLTNAEWKLYVGEGVEYQKTCK